MNEYSVKSQQYDQGQGEKSNYMPLIFIGILVAIVDLLLMDILPFSNSSGEQLVNDLMRVSFTGYLGLKIAHKLGIPLWWTKPEGKGLLPYLEVVGLGLFIILLNAFTTGRSGIYIRNLEGWVWFASVTPYTAILIAARSALTEEMFFRLFFIPLLALMVSLFIKTEKNYLAIAIGISAMVFGFLHPGFILAYVIALILGYLYSKYGVFPVMVIHFIANVIPFVYLSIV